MNSALCRSSALARMRSPSANAFTSRMVQPLSKRSSSLKAASMLVTKREYTSTTNQFDDFQHKYFSSSVDPLLSLNSIGTTDDLDARQFGYRVVSPTLLDHAPFSSKATSCSYRCDDEDDGLVVAAGNVWLFQEEGEEGDSSLFTTEYEPCDVGSSFLPQQDDLYEQEAGAEVEEDDSTTMSTFSSLERQQRQLSLAAEVLAAHKEWDALLASGVAAEVLAAHKEWDAFFASGVDRKDESTSGASSLMELQQRQLSTLAAEVLAAHEEWDALLELEADKPPHFECLKEDPYLSDYEEKRPQDAARNWKVVNHCHFLFEDDYCDYDDDLAIAQG